MIPETHQAALDELLRSAGLPAAAGNTVDLLAESTNTVYVVQTGETDFILRVYGDSGWPEIYDRARLAKVIHLHEVLAAKGVSVPRILGHVDHPDLQAVLMEHLPGQPLAEALDQVPLPERDDLWRAVGTSLQSVHEISLADIAGEIRGDQVVPFGDGEGPAWGWGTFATGDFLDDTDRLSRHLPSLKVDGDWLAEVMSRAREHLDESPVRLLHNDPTVDNIFVERSEDGWRCSGWIDYLRGTIRGWVEVLGVDRLGIRSPWRSGLGLRTIGVVSRASRARTLCGLLEGLRRTERTESRRQSVARRPLLRRDPIRKREYRARAACARHRLAEPPSAACSAA